MVDVLLKIEHLLLDPKFKQNLHGRLSAILREIDSTHQRLLACDFVEHVSWIFADAYPNENGLANAISVVRSYLLGNARIEDVAEARSKVYQSARDRDARAARIVIDVASMAINFCCQRDLEKLGAVVFVRRLERIDLVAWHAAFATARSAGAAEWTSNDPSLKKAARERGKQASIKETEWQIDRVLQVTGGRRRGTPTFSELF